MCVSIGGWGGGSVAARSCVGLSCRVLDNGPGIMVVDMAELPWRDKPELLGRMCTRAEVGTRLAKAVYKMFDAVLDQDHRFHSFLAS